MIAFVDGLLNKVTMYRLVVYELLFLVAAAMGLSAIGVLSFSPVMLAFSAAFLFLASLVFNWIFAWGFSAPYNPESTWITALILALIISPPSSWGDPSYLALATWAAGWAIASKYFFSIDKKHLFNPAAFGVAATSLLLGFSASWWVGTISMAPFTLLAGLLVVRKIHRFDLWIAFVAVFAMGVSLLVPAGGVWIFRALERSLLYAPAFFFSTVMLTEPMTTPPTRWLRIAYGALVGVLFLPNVHVGSFYLTPEIALLLGNVFAYAVSPKRKLVLTLKEKIRLSRDVYEFVFESPKRLRFRAGQYLEWTLAHGSPDSRSVRRYFTIASAPHDRDVRLGVKFYSPPSSFKRALVAMKPGDQIVASQLAGDFTLPRNHDRKLAFIAGGIGITPFRSQIEHALMRKERRSITVFYANKTPEDAVYRETLDRAQREIGAKIVYAFNDPAVRLPQGAVAVIDAATIAREMPDYRERTFYISGPQGMVTSFKDMLRGMGVPRWRIKTDYFPGFA